MPLNKKNRVIVRTWTSRLNGREVGHISLEIPASKTYISFWPGCEVGKVEAFMRSHEGAIHTFAEDIESERRLPDYVICLYGLETNDMEAAWNNKIKQIQTGELRWHLLGEKTWIVTESHSCASLVREILLAGGIEQDEIEACSQEYWVPELICKAMCNLKLVELTSHPETADSLFSYPAETAEAELRRFAEEKSSGSESRNFIACLSRNFEKLYRTEARITACSGLTTFAIGTVMELILELKWKVDNYLVEAAVSSFAISALGAVLSGALEGCKYKGEHYANEKIKKEELKKILATEVISFAVSFGAGIGISAAIEKNVPGASAEELTSAFGLATGVAAFKSLIRVGTVLTCNRCLMFSRQEKANDETPLLQPDGSLNLGAREFKV